jgi:hypothetical protein
MCGVTFVRSTLQERYCSDQCRHRCAAEIARAKRGAPSARTCVICGNEFASRRSRKKTCSESCSKQYGQNLARETAALKSFLLTKPKLPSKYKLRKPRLWLQQQPYNERSKEYAKRRHQEFKIARAVLQEMEQANVTSRSE